DALSAVLGARRAELVLLLVPHFVKDPYTAPKRTRDGIVRYPVRDAVDRVLISLNPAEPVARLDLAPLVVDLDGKNALARRAAAFALAGLADHLQPGQAETLAAYLLKGARAEMAVP